jgi:GNAT superfamily N-acetyltransferase
MLWRATAEGARHSDGAARKRAFEQRVQAGVPAGLLGYLNGEPVAWCSVAPRPTKRRLGGVDYDGVAEDGVWSVACFFVEREVRGRGVLAQLLAAAVDHARACGAVVVEGYPVRPTRRAIASWDSSLPSRPPESTRLGSRAPGGTSWPCVFVSEPHRLLGARAGRLSR